MKLSELSPAPGSTRPAWRRGRGPGSGNGKTGGRGHKGQKARSGGGVRPGFEGGQNPMYRRLPKRGFTNHRFSVDYAIINVEALEKYEANSEITLESLIADGRVSKPLAGLKVLGRGSLTKPLNIKAAVFSQAAIEKIESAGGKAEVI